MTTMHEFDWDVAYQGTAGAFAEDAAHAFLGDGARALPHRRLEDAIAAVTGGRAAYAVVPVENSLAGSVQASYDLLGAADTRIVGAVVLRIRHALIAPIGVSLEAVTRVHSHPVALAQCEELFRRNPRLCAVPAYNTAGAVRAVVEANRGDEAAIASPRAARLHGAVVLLHDVQDQEDNFTRFLLIGAPHAAAPDAPFGSTLRTTLMFTLPHRPGSLAEVLQVFARAGINLTRIESRPLRGRPFEYTFFVDVAVTTSTALRDAMEAAARTATSLRVLGTYATLGTPGSAT